MASAATGSDKVFCIGLNKTGTTSLEKALRDLGYRVGSQAKGEMLLAAYLRGEFTPIIEFCKTADAFQDIPFSLPFTYVPLDSAFSNAKFILSVRDTPEEWYHSLVRFMTQFFDGVRPTAAMLKECDYRYRGFMWDSMYGVLPLPAEDPFHKSTTIDFYNAHNDNARCYFRERSNFLELNLSDPSSYARMCAFLGREPRADAFPWLNRSAGA